MNDPIHMISNGYVVMLTLIYHYLYGIKLYTIINHASYLVNLESQFQFISYFQENKKLLT